MQPTQVSVIGLGYIGLPTAAVIASRGVQVCGVDVSQQTVDTINRGEIHIVEPDLDIVVRGAVTTETLRATCTPVVWASPQYMFQLAPSATALRAVRVPARFLVLSIRGMHPIRLSDAEPPLVELRLEMFGVDVGEGIIPPRFHTLVMPPLLG